jgi:hypothetical protein
MVSAEASTKRRSGRPADLPVRNLSFLLIFCQILHLPYAELHVNPIRRPLKAGATSFCAQGTNGYGIMDLAEPGWQVAAITTGLVALFTAWVVVRTVRNRDAFRRASDLQLPISVRVNAIVALSRNELLFEGRWRHDHVAPLLSDLSTYDRSPLIRHAAAEALRHIPGVVRPERAKK